MRDWWRRLARLVGAGQAALGGKCRTPAKPLTLSPSPPRPSAHPPRSDLITLINGQLSPGDRKRLITLCTIDVHARDVVQRLIDERVRACGRPWQGAVQSGVGTGWAGSVAGLLAPA